MVSNMKQQVEVYCVAIITTHHFLAAWGVSTHLQEVLEKAFVNRRSYLNMMPEV